MMKKKLISGVVAVLMLLGGVQVFGMAKAPKRLSMLVVPARYTVVQVAQDVAANMSCILVAYQGDAQTENPLLYAWTGSEWVWISIEDYASAKFIQRIPQQAILVGDEKMLPPVLIEASSWCPTVMNIPSIDTATLINSLGKALKFSNADWRWFAARYNLRLLDLNLDRRKSSWYDQPFVENRDKQPAVKSERQDEEIVIKENIAEVESGELADAPAPQAAPPMEAETMIEEEAVATPTAEAGGVKLRESVIINREQISINNGWGKRRLLFPPNK